MFAVGNSSNVFLLLRASDLGWSQEGVLGLYVIYNLTYAAAALPAGSLSNRIGRRCVLLRGFALSAVVYAGFAVADDRRRGLKEYKGVRRHLAAHLLGVRRVILTDAKDLGGSHREGSQSCCWRV